MAVYSCGSNKVGQLGLGNFDDSLEPVILETLKGKRISHVSCGEQHSLALTEFGDVYTWGRGREGQIGDGERKNAIQPVHVKALRHEKIVQADCGSYHNICITSTGQCYVWGKLHRFDSGVTNQYFAGFGQAPLSSESQEMIDHSMRSYLAGGLSLDKEEVSSNNFGNFVAFMQMSPLLMDFQKKKVVSVGAGYCFSIAVTDDGEAYSWGFNEKGQLGHGHRFNIESPKRIEALADVPIAKTACGYEHTVLLDKKGNVWTVGLGVFGQLGHGDASDKLLPHVIEHLAKSGVQISQISCGSYYTSARTSQGTIYSWGHSEYAQHGGTANHLDWQVGLGAGASKEKKMYDAMPRPLMGFEDKPIKHMACGHLHSVVITDNDEVFSFGWGPSGCLGHGDRRFQLIPKQILAVQGEKISHVACGWKHTLIVKEGSNTTFAFDFKPLIDSKSYSDVTFDIEGKIIHAHRVILGSRVPYFSQMFLFHARFGPGVKYHFQMKGIRYPTFVALLRYVYTDHLKVASHLNAELANWAIKLGIPRLAELCRRNRIREENFQIKESTFKHDMLVAVNSPLFSDVSFMVQGTRIYGHRSILTKRSQYFERLLESDFKERDQKEFKVDDSISPAIFIDVMKHLYAEDESIIKPDTCIELLHAADRFMIEDLKLVIEAYVEQSIDADMAAYILEVADRYGCYRLKRECFDVICSNIENWNLVKTSKSFQELALQNPHLLREIDYKCAKSQLTKPGEVIRLQHILAVN